MIRLLAIPSACILAAIAFSSCTGDRVAGDARGPTTSTPATISTLGTAAESTTTTVSTSTTEPPEPTYLFPILPADSVSYSPAHHDYPAADMFATCGSEVVAPTRGVLSEVSTEDVWSSSTNDGATRGGLSFTLVGDDGVRYYGSHLASIEPAMAAGTRLEQGDLIGLVGDTGNAAGTGCHLHFGISPPCGLGDWQVRRGTIGPAPFLDAWRSGDTSASPLSEVQVWREQHSDECP